MGETIEGEVRPDIKDFHHVFTRAVKQLDESAEGVMFGRKSGIAARLREVLGGKDASDFDEANQRIETFYRAQLGGRDMSSYGPISSTAAEVLFEASQVELQLSDEFPQGTYLMGWKSKFLTGFITGSNPKDVATWRFDLTYEPGSYRHPNVAVQYETDWSQWNKFKSPVHQNYPLQTVVHETEYRQGEPWQLTEPEATTISTMKYFVQRGRLREIRSWGDTVAAAIIGASKAVTDTAAGYDPADVFNEVIRKYNSRRK